MVDWSDFNLHWFHESSEIDVYCREFGRMLGSRKIEEKYIPTAPWLPTQMENLYRVLLQLLTSIKCSKNSTENNKIFKWIVYLSCMLHIPLYFPSVHAFKGCLEIRGNTLVPVIYNSRVVVHQWK